MGWNTTVVVLNDALSFIEDDPEFGRKLAQAVRASVHSEHCPVRVSAGNYSTAALVIETHHMDHEATVKVGGNTGRLVKDFVADDDLEV